MRGIILAGGTGSRLGDLTKVVNKHLLPVGGHPMIYWPIKVLRDNDISDITVVSSARGVGQLAELLGGRYTYRVQDKPGGIAQAIACANIRGDRTHEHVAVVLGDNVFLPSPDLLRCRMIGERARCYLKEVPSSRIKEFGVPTFGVDGSIKYVTEKPENPSNNYAVTGLYIFSSDVFDKIVAVGLSFRGEAEVTDLLNIYASCGLLEHTVVDGFWGDAGTVDGMADCTAAVSKLVK